MQWIVQTQQALIPQLQDRGRGKGLRHRGDSDDRVLIRAVRTIESDHAETARPEQSLLADNPQRQPGQTMSRSRRLGQRLDGGFRVLLKRHGRKLTLIQVAAATTIVA